MRALREKRLLAPQARSTHAGTLALYFFVSPVVVAPLRCDFYFIAPPIFACRFE
jgi:hypothetical protein